MGRLENRLGVRMRNYDWVDGGVLAEMMDRRVVVVWKIKGGEADGGDYEGW